MNDIKFALRQLLKQPLFAMVVVLSLAIGIGANTIVLTWIRSLLLNPMPGVHEQNRLVVVCTQQKTAGLNDTLSEPDIASISEEKQLFSAVTGSDMGTALMRVGEQLDWLWIEAPMANYFDALGVKPQLGRGFLPGEDAPSPAQNAVVISDQLWHRRFGADPSIIGRAIEINRQPATIVGVAPADFRGTMGALGFDAWIVPALYESHDRLVKRSQQRGWRWSHTVARLAPGVSLSTARAGMATEMDRLAREYPGYYSDTSLVVLPLWKSPWGGQGRFLPLLQALGVAVAMLLLLVTANVAHLLLSRSFQRESEMAVRLALGARPSQIIRLLLVESLFIALISGLLGCTIASVGARLFFALMPPTYLPIAIDLGLNGWVLGITAIVTVVVGLAFGLAPALQCARTNIQGTLKEGARSVVRSTRNYLRTAFVVGEVALASVLLIGMGLCLRSLEKSRQVNIGMDPDNVFAAGFRFGPNDGDDAAVNAFALRLRQEAVQLPGVESVALADWLPLGFEGGSSTTVEVDGYTPARGESMDVGVSQVSPGYFSALRIPLKDGRGFEERDTRDKPLAIVVNEEFVRRYFGGRKAVGLKVHFWSGEGTIVGVAANGKYRYLNDPDKPWLYVNQLQRTLRTPTLIVRSGASPAVLQPAIERLATHIDPVRKPFAAMPFDVFVAAAWAVPKMAASLLSVLGALALGLAVLGIYAVVSQQVTQRTREMAIRMALGARPVTVFRTILRSGLVLAVSGLCLGALAGVGLSRGLGSMLIGIGPGDWLTWGGMTLILLLTVLLASWLPARRAAKVNPMEALRNE